MKVLDVFIMKARESLPPCEGHPIDIYEVPLMIYDGKGLSGYIDIRMIFRKQKIMIKSFQSNYRSLELYSQSTKK